MWANVAKMWSNVIKRTQNNRVQTCPNVDKIATHGDKTTLATNKKDNDFNTLDICGYKCV